MDRNLTILVGRVGNAIKKSKTVNGEDYIWFPLYIENSQGATSTENNYHQGINIMVFKQPVIKYVDRVKMRQGNIVIIFGFVSAFKQEIKGQQLVSHGINATELYVVKTS